MSASAHLAIVASAIYLVRLLPQPIKTLRTGKVEGASWLGAANTLIADGAWFAYGLTAHIPPVWLVSIPAVAASAWTVALLRNEITAVRENNAKMVALNQRDAQTKWGQLEVFMTQWRRIEALIPEPGPFIWRVSRTAMTPIALD